MAKFNVNNDFVKKAGGVLKMLAVPVVMGVVSFASALSDQKKAEKYEAMEKAFDALNQKES